MAIDVGRVVQAALEAATQGPSSDGEAKKPKPHLSGRRGLLLGFGLVTVGRLAAPKGREMLGSLQQKLEAFESAPEDEKHEDAADYDEEPEGEGEEDFDEEQDEEPEGESDEDFDEEEDEEEPEGEGEEDFDEEEDEDEDEPPRPRKPTKSRARSRS
jgi:hypothetical protein